MPKLCERYGQEFLMQEQEKGQASKLSVHERVRRAQLQTLQNRKQATTTRYSIDMQNKEGFRKVL